MSENLRKPAAISLEPGSQADLRDADDVFAPPSVIDEDQPVPTAKKKGGFPWVGLFLASAGALISLILVDFLQGLILRFTELHPAAGYAALGIAALFFLAFFFLIFREVRGFFSLRRITELRSEAETVIASGSVRDGRKFIRKLVNLYRNDPASARARQKLEALEDDIIDAPHLIGIAEKELLADRDAKATAAISAAARRVSLVTAISPRALLDIFYAGYESIRLIRTIASVYGTRPGFFGFLSLLRRVGIQLGVTGLTAASDDFVQQIVGQGLAAKISRRFGEGVVNGLMAARVGLAAMEACRPLPFSKIRQPKLSDVAGKLFESDPKK